MHPRLLARNRHVAASELKGQVSAKRFVEGAVLQVAAPVANVLRAPDKGVDCQLLFGAGFRVLDTNPENGFSFGQSIEDGYVGYIKASQLDTPREVTHRITALASHRYPNADMKQAPIARLSFGSLISGAEATNGFFALADGSFVPRQHVSPAGMLVPDYVGTMMRFAGTPYLWGGNSVWGVDCSGLLQLALKSAGVACPRDSDMQETSLGSDIPDDASLKRGDLIFWSGHVGAMVDAETMIHATASVMAVTLEPLNEAITRIIASGGGEVTRRKRL